MNEKYIVYAKNMDEIGDKIISISNECFTYDENMLLNLKACIELGYKGVEKYKECLALLRNTEVPSLVKREHDEITRAWNEFINAVESEYITIDAVNDDKFILEVLNESVSLQKKVSAETSKLCEQIGDKLLK